MNFPKTVAILCLDSVAVDVDSDSDVALRINGRASYMSPDQARRIAKALKKAAKRAEVGQ